MGIDQFDPNPDPHFQYFGEHRASWFAISQKHRHIRLKIMQKLTLKDNMHACFKLFCLTVNATAVKSTCMSKACMSNIEKYLMAALN